MQIGMRTGFAGVASASFLLIGAAGASTRPTPLADSQMDGVTAGAVTVVTSNDAAATGPLSIAGTTSNTFAVRSAPQSQPGLGVNAGLAEGTAVAVGTDVGFAKGPTSASTSVRTAGAADGNLQITQGVNYTVQGAGGVQFQAGWTFVFGAWIGP
jgi:hypothetical protein